MKSVRRKAIDRSVIWLTATALLILLGTILLSYRDWILFRDASADARHARDVLESTESILSSVKDTETGQRGYLLTGEAEYLQPYREALAAIPDELKRLTEATSGQPQQSEWARQLEVLVMAKMAELKLTLDTVRDQGLAAAIAVVNTNRGKRTMDQIRDVCSQISKTEYADLTERRLTFQVSGQRTRLLTTIGSAILFVLLVLASAIISRAAVRREQLIEEVSASEKRIAEVRDLLQTTLSSIGDAVITTDAQGRVVFMNPVAQALTQYTQELAAGQPLDAVFHIVNEGTRNVVESPAAKVLRDGSIVGLANHTVLLGRNGAETPIDDSGAPIRDENGVVIGVVLVFRDITERKKAEEERERLASIVSFSGDAIISQRLDGIVTSWNAAAVQMFGYPETEMVGRPFAVVEPEGSPDDPGDVIARIRSGEAVVHYEAIRIRKDGSRVEVAAVASPIRDGAGKIAGVSRVCRDVTERRRADEALRRSNKQTVDILESIRDGFLALDKDWVFTYVNAEAERRLGKSRTELVGKDYWQESPGVAESPTGMHLRRCVATQTPISFEEYRPDLGGWFEVNLYPAAEGGLSMYFRDVTGRKRTEEALRESEEQLRLSAEAAQIGVWHQDCVTGRLHWSRQLERLYGLEPGAFRGTVAHRLELIHPEDRERVTDIFRRAIEKDTDFEVEHRMARADGEIRWLLSRGRALYSDGRVTALAGVTMDITSRRRFEEKLRQSQKLESLGVLAGGIAHDFNNLLVGILGNASVLLEDTPPESPSREIIENLTQAGERAAHLTRQMLAYSGKGRFVVERLNLGCQVREILALIEASISKGVKVELRFDDNLPPVEGDAGQIQQLIMNLMINGAEAIGPGGGTMSVSAALLEIGNDYVRDNLAGDNIPAGAYVALKVHDNGIGMDAATQARIFDPFFTTKFTGRGLGLAAVLGIVRGHRGALTVHSEPGKGTTFTIFLPAAPVEQAAAAASIPEAAEFRGAGTILVVDDEELVQRTLKIALERYGYTVVAAGGGDAAIRIVGEGGDAISLVLLDMTMPGMSGEQTLHNLRATHPRIPVIATSGYNEVEALRRFGVGLNGFIQKPYIPRQLAWKIRDVLQNGASPARV